MDGIRQEGGLFFVRMKVEVDLGEANGVFFENQGGLMVFAPIQFKCRRPRHFLPQILFHISFFFISSSST